MNSSYRGGNLAPTSRFFREPGIVHDAGELRSVISIVGGNPPKDIVGRPQSGFHPTPPRLRQGDLVPQRRPAHDVAQRRTMFAPYRIDHRPSQQTDPKIEQCEEKWRDASVRKAAVGLSQEFAEELKVGWTLTTSGMSWVRWRWVCILVRVHLELTSKSAPGQVVFKLQLQPAEMGMRFANGNTKPGEDEFTINSVPAGRYSAVPMPTYGYVDRMTCGGTNLLEQSLVVTGSGSPEPIHVTIRDDTATLSGNIQTGDDARSGRSFVFLLSEQGNHPIQTSVAINGEFTFGNIPPGTYRLFAVSNLVRELPYPAEQPEYKPKDHRIRVSFNSLQRCISNRNETGGSRSVRASLLMY